MQEKHKKEQNKIGKWKFTGQYLPILNPLTNAIPLPQPLNDMNVSLTRFTLSIEKRPTYNAGSFVTFSAYGTLMAIHQWSSLNYS